MLLLYDADVHLGNGWNDTLGTGGLGIIKSVEQVEEIELELTFNFIVVQETPGQALATMEELEELDWFLSRLDRVA